MNVSGIDALRPKVFFGPGCFAAICATLLLAACSRVDDLPEMPAIATDAFEPKVRAELQVALAAARRRPANAKINGRLGMTLHTYQVYPAAEIAYQRARKLHARSARWAYYHADVLLALGRHSEAIAALRDAIQLDPDYAPAYARLAGLLTGQRAFEESAVLLDTILESHPGHADALYELGRLLNLRGKPQMAITTFEKALVISGPDARTYFSLARAHGLLGHSDRVDRFNALHRKYLRQPQQKWDPLMATITAMNQSSTSMLDRAKSHYVAGHIDAAIDLIEQVLDRQPDNLPAHVALVGIYARTGLFDLADKHYEMASKRSPVPPILYLNLAVARSAEQRWVEAAALVDQALTIEPNNAAAHTQLGLIRAAQGRIDDAIRHYRLAIENDPDSMAAREALGTHLVQAGRYQEAIATLGDIHPTDDEISARMLLTLAIAYENSGNVHAAIDALQLALPPMVQDQAGSLNLRIRRRLDRLTAESAAQ